MTESVVVTVDFKSCADILTTESVPVKWTLTNMDESIVINEGEIAVETPTSTTNIVLSGDDLALFDTEKALLSVKRKLTINVARDVTVDGADLPMKLSNYTIITIHNPDAYWLINKE